MSNRAKIALMSSGVVLVALIAVALFWVFSGPGGKTNPEHEHMPPDGTPDVADTINPDRTKMGDSRETAAPPNGPNVPEEEEGFRTSPDPMQDQPPPSPPPPRIDPNPSGEGEKDIERIPPSRPAIDLRQELERVHKDVGATARAPLSLFR